MKGGQAKKKNLTFFYIRVTNPKYEYDLTMMLAKKLNVKNLFPTFLR